MIMMKKHNDLEMDFDMRGDTMFGFIIGMSAGFLIIHYLLFIKLGIGLPELFGLPDFFNKVLALLAILILWMLVINLLKPPGAMGIGDPW